MTSKIIISRPSTNGIITFGLDALTDIYANVVSGDNITVYPGTYALGDNTVQLKDGTKFTFIGNPTITSDSALGSFSDNNSAVTVHFSGDLTITNSNGLASRIILQHASTDLQGFCWEYDAELTQASTSAPTAVIKRNTLGGVPTLTRDSLGVYIATLTEGFDSTASVLMSYYDNAPLGDVKNLVTFVKAANSITIACYDNAETAALKDLGAKMTINIKVYP